MRIGATFAVVLVCAALGCADPEDLAAKARIFSPEDPPQAVAAASEPLADAKPADAARILTMSGAEATERLGAHRFHAEVNWEWSDGTTRVSLEETRDIVAGAGGVSGDFQVKSANAHDWGLEFIRVKGRVFARNTWGGQGAGRFRERLRDRGMAERVREDAYGVLREVFEVFEARPKFSQTPIVLMEGGRRALKYAVALGGARAAPETNLPPLIVAKGGVDVSSQLRKEFWQRKSPLSLDGEVVVDAATGVVLKSNVVGRLKVPTRAGAVASLTIRVDTKFADVGKVQVVSLPSNYLQDEDKPNAVARALTRFGFGRLRDGGLEAPEPEVGDETSEAPKAR